MLFLFILFFFFHNNNGGFMKKIFLIFLLVLSFKVNAMGSFYISKKDIDTNDFISDCDFLLYDSDGNIVDSWIQENEVHVSNIPGGVYRLVERPKIVNTFSDYLSKSYDLSIRDDDMVEFILYNKKIDTPDNLSIKNNYYGILFIVSGLFLIFISCKYKYI